MVKTREGVIITAGHQDVLLLSKQESSKDQYQPREPKKDLGDSYLFCSVWNTSTCISMLLSNMCLSLTLGIEPWTYQYLQHTIFIDKGAFALKDFSNYCLLLLTQATKQNKKMIRFDYLVIKGFLKYTITLNMLSFAYLVSNDETE